MNNNTNAFGEAKQLLLSRRRKRLITGVAEFIGPNCLSHAKLDQTIVGLDNLSTGFQRNLDDVLSSVAPEQVALFLFIQGYIRKFKICGRALD